MAMVEWRKDGDFKKPRIRMAEMRKDRRKVKHITVWRPLSAARCHGYKGCGEVIFLLESLPGD